jgi:lysophospholipase L1-like esterase
MMNYGELSLKSKIIFISLIINLVYTVAFGGIFFKKKVMPYFASNEGKNSIIQERQNRSLHYPLYYIEKSVFEILPNNKNEIVFLGDSLTSYCQWGELLQNQNVKNRGLRSDRTDSLILRLDEVTSSLPDKVFIMIGINDLVAKRKIDHILSDYENILNNIIEKSPRTKIYIQSLLPVNNQIYQSVMNRKLNVDNTDVKRLNNRLKNLAQKFGIEYIDLFSSFSDGNHKLKKEYTENGLHINGNGYLLWKAKIEKKITNPNQKDAASIWPYTGAKQAPIMPAGRFGELCSAS